MQKVEQQPALERIKYMYAANCQSHVNNANNNRRDFSCPSCGRVYSHASSLSRHKKVCDGKGPKDELIPMTRRDLEHLLKEMEWDKEKALLETRLECSQEQNKQKDAFIMSGKMVPTYNISVKKYIQQQYPSAPPLKPLPDYGKLLRDHQLKDKDTKGRSLIDALIYYNEKKKLHEYLGNFLIPYYKHNDPMYQSMWVTDKNRFTYFIMEHGGKTQAYWVVDPSGVKVRNKIVKPLLDHLRSDIDDHLAKIRERAKKMSAKKQLGLHDERKRIEEVRSKIKNSLANKIIKYIAPFFYMDLEEDGTRVDSMKKKKELQYYEDFRNKKIDSEDELIDSDDDTITSSYSEEEYINEGISKYNEEYSSSDDEEYKD